MNPSFIETTDLDDPMILMDMLSDNEQNKLYIFDIGVLLIDIKRYVNDYVHYLMHTCIPSIELDIGYMEEEGIFEYYNVPVEVFEKHHSEINRIVFEKTGYQGLYNNTPYKLVGDYLYILIN